MATLAKQEILDAFTHLGQLASDRGETIQLMLMGGSVMVLVFESRLSTRDVDVMVMPPSNVQLVRQMASIVASERGWPHDWLNDAAKGFLVNISAGPVIFTAPGIEVRRPPFEQLLAMKLCAWRDDVDIADAMRLLQELPSDYHVVWKQVEQFLQPGKELKAKYAFDDLWEEAHGSH